MIVEKYPSYSVLLSHQPDPAPLYSHANVYRPARVAPRLSSPAPQSRTVARFFETCVCCSPVCSRSVCFCVSSSSSATLTRAREAARTALTLPATTSGCGPPSPRSTTVSTRDTRSLIGQLLHPPAVTAARAAVPAFLPMLARLAHCGFSPAASAHVRSLQAGPAILYSSQSCSSCVPALCELLPVLHLPHLSEIAACHVSRPAQDPPGRALQHLHRSVVSYTYLPHPLLQARLVPAAPVHPAAPLLGLAPATKVRLSCPRTTPSELPRLPLYQLLPPIFASPLEMLPHHQVVSLATVLPATKLPRSAANQKSRSARLSHRRLSPAEEELAPPHQVASVLPQLPALTAAQVSPEKHLPASRRLPAAAASHPAPQGPAAAPAHPALRARRTAAVRPRPRRPRTPGKRVRPEQRTHRPMSRSCISCSHIISEPSLHRSPSTEHSTLRSVAFR